MFGGGSSVGNPCDRRVSFGIEAHPCVVEVFRAMQANAMPGTEFAAEVARKVETGSNAMPEPARNTVFCPQGLQVNASRGANAVMFERAHQLFVRTKVTGPWEPSTGLSGTKIGWLDSVGGLLYSHRTP